MKQEKLFWAIIIFLLCAMIFYLTSSSQGSFMGTEHIFHSYNYYARNMAHVSVFGLLAVAVQRILNINKFSYLLAWIFVTTYGASDEWHQMFLLNRTPLWSDVVLDSTGAFLALVIVYLWFHFKNNRKNELR